MRRIAIALILTAVMLGALGAATLEEMRAPPSLPSLDTGPPPLDTPLPSIDLPPPSLESPLADSDVRPPGLQTPLTPADPMPSPPAPTSDEMPLG